MKTNAISPNFGARIVKNKAADQIANYLSKSANFDNLSVKADFEKLCQNLNKAFPSDDDIIEFTSLTKDPGAYSSIRGKLTHNGKVANFLSILTDCSESYLQARSILHMITNVGREIDNKK